MLTFFKLCLKLNISNLFALFIAHNSSILINYLSSNIKNFTGILAGQLCATVNLFCCSYKDWAFLIIKHTWRTYIVECNISKFRNQNHFAFWYRWTFILWISFGLLLNLCSKSCNAQILMQSYDFSSFIFSIGITLIGTFYLIFILTDVSVLESCCLLFLTLCQFLTSNHSKFHN